MGKKAQAHSSYHVFILCAVITVTLRSSCLIKHVIEGKIYGRVEVTGTRGRRGKQVRKNEETGNKSHSVASLLWKRLHTCRKTGCGINE